MHRTKAFRAAILIGCVSSFCYGADHDDGRFAAKAYLAVLGRSSAVSTIDYGGWDFWMGNLNQGFTGNSPTSRSYMVSQFMVSQEYQSLQAAFVANKGPVSPNLYYQSCAAAPYATPPFPQTSDSDYANKLFVFMLYTYGVNRCPDTGGFTFWVSLLGSGEGKGELLTDFSQSSEFNSGSQWLPGGHQADLDAFLIGTAQSHPTYMPTGQPVVTDPTLATRSDLYRFDISAPEGSAELSQVSIQADPQPPVVGTCSFRFLPASQQLVMLNDAGFPIGNSVIGPGGRILAGPHCNLDAGRSSAANPGSALSLYLYVAFNAMGSYNWSAQANAVGERLIGPRVSGMGTTVVQDFNLVVTPSSQTLWCPTSFPQTPNIITFQVQLTGGHPGLDCQDNVYVSLQSSSFTILGISGQGPNTTVYPSLTPSVLSLAPGGQSSATLTIQTNAWSCAANWNFIPILATGSTQQTTVTKIFSPQLIENTTLPSPPTVITQSLPGGTAGAYYQQSLQATGGTGSSYTWSIVSGGLPTGLTLSSIGVISGIATAASGEAFTVQAMDSQGLKGTRALTLGVVAGSPTITTASVPGGSTAAPFPTQTLSATAGTPPYVLWSVTSGSLPPGLSLSSPGGILSGTPTVAGSYGFTVQVMDSSGQKGTRTFTLTVANSAFVISGHVLQPNGAGLAGVTLAVSGDFSATITADATGSYSITLPPGRYVVTPSTLFGKSQPGSGSYGLTSNRPGRITASDRFSRRPQTTRNLHSDCDSSSEHWPARNV